MTSMILAKTQRILKVMLESQGDSLRTHGSSPTGPTKKHLWEAQLIGVSFCHSSFVWCNSDTVSRRTRRPNFTHSSKTLFVISTSLNMIIVKSLTSERLFVLIKHWTCSFSTTNTSCNNFITISKIRGQGTLRLNLLKMFLNGVSSPSTIFNAQNTWNNSLPGKPFKKRKRRI